MVKDVMTVRLLAAALAAAWSVSLRAAGTNEVVELGSVVVEASALSRYRPEKVSGATFSDLPPEKSPTVVDTLTEDFIRERNPTDLNDLLRWVPGIETGGTSLLVRQPGCFSIRGMGGTEPAFDGVIPVGRAGGLFMDPFLMERVEIVKGPIASLSGGAGAQQNNNGAGGSVNLHLKGAHLRASERNFSEATTVGRNLWRQRGMIDANEVIVDDRFAVRLVGSLDLYSPVYASRGSQEGARPREAYSLAPSFVVRPNEKVTFGLKSILTRSDAPSYIGVPVWRGHAAGGYDIRESSCRKGDRSRYSAIMVNPYLDWQVTDDWLVKFGGAFMYSHMEQKTREPYTESGEGLQHFFATGHWLDESVKYQTTNFSESRFFGRSFNVYARSVYSKEELPGGFRNTLVVQPDFYWREQYSMPVTRWGVTAQDSVGWGWVTLLGGIRYDYFIEDASTVTTESRGVRTTTVYDEARTFAFSPRGGLTVQPLEWLVFFGNLSQTRTPQLGLVSADGSRPKDPWKATQWEGGVRVRPLEKLWFSASYYDIDQRNIPVADTDGYYHFEGHKSSRGVELSLSGDLTEDWTVMAMYAFNRYTDHDVAKGEKGRDFARTPRHAVTLNTSYRIPTGPLEGVAFTFGYRFRSKSYATMRGSYVDENLFFKPSHVFDFGLTVPFDRFGLGDAWKDWFLTLGVRNIFDEEYFDTSRHYYECFAGEPRTFEIGIRGSF